MKQAHSRRVVDELDTPIVTGDFSAKRTPRTHLPNRKIMAAVVTVVLLVAGIGLIAARQPQTCSDSMLQSAVSHSDPAEVTSLSGDVARVRSIKNYQHDPNCMYVITVYDINQSDASGATADFALLKQHYDANKGFRPVLRQVPGIDALAQQVAFLNRPVDQADNNARER